MKEISKFDPWRLRNDEGSLILDVESRLSAVSKMTKAELQTAYKFNGNQRQSILRSSVGSKVRARR